MLCICLGFGNMSWIGWMEVFGHPVDVFFDVENCDESTKKGKVARNLFIF